MVPLLSPQLPSSQPLPPPIKYLVSVDGGGESPASTWLSLTLSPHLSASYAPCPAVLHNFLFALRGKREAERGNERLKHLDLRPH